LKKKTPAEMERARITKTARTWVRLKHSLAADEELNSILPDTLAEFDEALARGELRALDGNEAVRRILRADDAGS
jgi:hypothetical protein